MKPTPETRHSLLMRLTGAVDEAAWKEFVEIYEPLVYRIARQRGLQDADSRDVSQQVLIAVSRNLDRWDPEQRGSFRGWLFRIARNLTINLLIQQRRHVRGSGDSDVRQLLEQKPADDSDETAEFDLQFKRQKFQWAAERIRLRFHGNTWQAFWKTCVEGASIELTARQLKMSVGAIYVARSRVMARLRETIEGIEKP
jgi:RNA polymerase sigma-70 factor (ECF subfamily)